MKHFHGQNQRSLKAGWRPLGALPLKLQGGYYSWHIYVFMCVCHKDAGFNFFVVDILLKLCLFLSLQKETADAETQRRIQVLWSTETVCPIPLNFRSTHWQLEKNSGS